MASRPLIHPALAIFTVSFAAAFPGSLAINSAIPFWYIAAAKPSWAPPLWSLMPVWLIVQAGLAGAVTVVWKAAGRGRTAALVLLSLTTLLGSAWATTLFYGHRTMPAVVLVGLAGLAGVLASIAGGRVGPTGRWLTLPLAWTVYAAAFTVAMHFMNTHPNPSH